jgi:Xaa-Pro aminopeptidase
VDGPMFDRDIYCRRRERLKARIESGIVLLPGNGESPMNYAANTYPFRQDSTFLYYFGLDQPGLAAVIDIDAGTECIFGDDPTIDDIVWTGPQPLLRDRCERVGVTQTAPSDKLEQVLMQAAGQGRPIHYLPQYRPENRLRIADLRLDPEPSEQLVRAVIEQRSVKSGEEIEQIEMALDITRQMHVAAMKLARPGVRECEVAGAMEGIAVSRGVRLAYPTVLTAHGETLHNLYSRNILAAGDVAINDSGAESPQHYASDITRTIPVSGTFSPRQRDVYSIVLNATDRAIGMTKPGVEWRDVHRAASVALMEGLKELGLVKGDPEEAVAAGAHTLFFPCGVGHMMGLDVHDMEPLGEDYIGYTDTIRRNPDFGWRHLRLAKAVEPGFVVTVEPGVYFIPQLIDRRRSENKYSRFIDYDRVETWRDSRGIRVEDNILVTSDACRVLGPPIPRTVEEVEAVSSA